jgi:hypothetical protein
MTSYQDLIMRAIAERGPDHPVWRYNDKMSARKLAELTAIRAPELFDGPTDLDDLSSPGPPFVLKPVSGSSGRGVFPIGDQWMDLLRHRRMSWAQIIQTAARVERDGEALAATGHQDAIRGPWFTEELIGDGTALPDEWKAMVFGGEVVAIWHGRGRPQVHYRWHDRNWDDVGDIQPIRQRVYDETLSLPRDPDAMIAAFEAVARHVESKFVRVDLYEDAGGPVFGEIGVHPHGGRVRFTPEWDERLGRIWQSALDTRPSF